MGILERLGLTGSRGASGGESADTDTVRRIAAALDALDPARARFLAAFAYVLSRVAAADFNVSEPETDAMAGIVRRVGQIDEAQSLLVVEMAKQQNRLFGGTEDFLVTREFRRIATDEQRAQLLESLFAVSASDDTIEPDEEARIRQIASELGFEHEDYIRARLAYTTSAASCATPADARPSERRPPPHGQGGPPARRPITPRRRVH